MIENVMQKLEFSTQRIGSKCNKKSMRSRRKNLHHEINEL